MSELETVLVRQFSLSRSEISEVHSVISEASKELVLQIDPIAPVCRDADDGKILACAHNVGADYLATGDEDLLVIGKYGIAKIIAPRDFESFFPD